MKLQECDARPSSPEQVWRVPQSDRRIAPNVPDSVERRTLRPGEGILFASLDDLLRLRWRTVKKHADLLLEFVKAQDLSRMREDGGYHCPAFLVDVNATASYQRSCKCGWA